MKILKRKLEADRKEAYEKRKRIEKAKQEEQKEKKEFEKGKDIAKTKIKNNQNLNPKIASLIFQFRKDDCYFLR